MKDKTARIKKINYFWSVPDMGSVLSMKWIFTLCVIIFFHCFGVSYGQFLIPGEGIMDVKLGADWDEIEWELGFRGKKLEKAEVGEEMNLIAQKAGIDFDFMISYQHIMWLPVSDLLFKDNKVCLIQLSSYPEYNQMLSADIGTLEGLNFWDTREEIKNVYGDYPTLSLGSKSVVLIADKGLGMELSENEVRTMFIFLPQMQ